MIHQQATIDRAESNVYFLPGLFEETAEMLLESHSYFNQLEDAGGDNDYYDMLLTNEMTRITMRLTSVMAWIMARKAVYNGQMTHQQAQEEYPLDGLEVCLQDTSAFYPVLPRYLNCLLDRSHQLYQRVQRLDEMIEETPRLH